MEPGAADLLANATGRGFIEAPAGFGKTELIADALTRNGDRELVLTHTHAGVDSLRKRLKLKDVPRSRFRLDTIDAFCLKLSTSYPSSSGAPRSPDSPLAPVPFPDYHRATTRLLANSGMRQVISASYGGVIIDEYQDCSLSQHEFVMALSDILPVKVLGDPLQKLLGFSSEGVVNWDSDVLGNFAKLADLVIPHRWQQPGADPRIAKWLGPARQALLRGDAPVYADPIRRHLVEVAPNLARILRTLPTMPGDRIVVLNRFPREMHETATRLCGLGYSCMEEIEAKDLKVSCQGISGKQGIDLALALVAFVAICCTQPQQRLDRILAKLQSGNLSGIVGLVPRTISDYLASRGESLGFTDALEFMDLLVRLQGRRMYRRELYYSMRRAFSEVLSKPELNLVEAAHNVRQRVSHGGRRDELRIVSRPILVKGLQYEHVVVLNPHLYQATELYVALSRATKSVTVAGPNLNRIAHTSKERKIGRRARRVGGKEQTPALERRAQLKKVPSNARHFNEMW